MTDFEKLLRALAEGGVEFILVGGVAATAHGSARLTVDLDVVYRRSDENIARLAATVGKLRPYLRGAPPGLPFAWDAQTIRSGLNFTLTTDLGDLDLLGEIAGGGAYDALLPHTIVLKIFGIKCRCLDLEHLIHVKRAAGRPKDFEAIAELEALAQETERADGRGDDVGTSSDSADDKG
jgi:predicted nucleotidyltransferase